MSFTYEVEENNKQSFLDVSVSREENKFSTFSVLYTNCVSFIADGYQKGLIYCLLFRAFILTVNWQKFHDEVKFVKVIFRKNLFP